MILAVFFFLFGYGRFRFCGTLLCITYPTFQIILGATQIVVADGIWTRLRWGWTLCLLVSAASIALSVWGIGMGFIVDPRDPGLLSIILNVAVIGYLTTIPVREYFGMPSS